MRNAFPFLLCLMAAAWTFAYPAGAEPNAVSASGLATESSAASSRDESGPPRFAKQENVPLRTAIAAIISRSYSDRGLPIESAKQLARAAFAEIPPELHQQFVRELVEKMVEIEKKRGDSNRDGDRATPLAEQRAYRVLLALSINMPEKTPEQLQRKKESFEQIKKQWGKYNSLNSELDSVLSHIQVRIDNQHPIPISVRKAAHSVWSFCSGAYRTLIPH